MAFDDGVQDDERLRAEYYSYILIVIRKSPDLLTLLLLLLPTHLPAGHRIAGQLLSLSSLDQLLSLPNSPLTRGRPPGVPIKGVLCCPRAPSASPDRRWASEEEGRVFLQLVSINM